jgi:alkylhydroperoxidase family enzyme
VRAIRRELGAAPELFASLAASPTSLRGLWSALEGTLLAGVLPRTTKELIALATFSMAEVGPLRDWLRAALNDRGVASDLVADLAARGETERLPERTQELLRFGRRAALQAARLTDADVALLRRAKVGDAELAELVALAGQLAGLVAASRALGLT